MTIAGLAFDPAVGRARVVRAIVTRALVARANPLRRPDDVAAPQRVGPRVKPGDDEVEGASKP